MSRRADGPEAGGGQFRPMVLPMSPADIDQVAGIELRCFSEPWTRGMLRSELDNPFSRCLVALREPRQLVAGYIMFHLAADECHLVNLATDLPFRRQGVAGSLFGRLLESCREYGARIVWLEVRRSNQAAIGLYRRLGFRLAGERRGYYRDNGEDALIMVRELEG